MGGSKLQQILISPDVQTEVHIIRERLIDEGLLVSGHRQQAAKIVSAAFLIAVVLLLGLPRLLTANPHAKTGNLQFLIIVMLVGVFMFCFCVGERTRVGDQALDAYRARYPVQQSQRDAAASHEQVAAVETMGLGFGLGLGFALYGLSAYGTQSVGDLGMATEVFRASPDFGP